MSSSIYQSIRERATPESVMLVLMLVVSTYMLVESRTFSREVALFPRFAAIVTICGALLLLFQRYLPKTLQETVAESSTMFDQRDSIQEVEAKAQSRTDEHEQESAAEPTPEHDQQRSQLLLVGLLAVYGVIGYAIGLVMATPVFLALYVVLFDVRRTIGVVLIVVGVAIALAFNSILPVNLVEGQLW